MGYMTGSEIVGVCCEAAVTACCKMPWMTTNFIVGYSDVPMYVRTYMNLLIKC